jgi:hypothetical protein
MLGAELKEGGGGILFIKDYRVKCLVSDNACQAYLLM